MDNITVHPDDSHPMESTASFVDLRFFLVRIFYPCLLIWGTIGNALCLRVLLSKKFFKNSTCQYLAVLAVIDILFILMRSSKHVYKLFRDTSIFNTSQWVCRILTFFSSALAHMASWILVIVSFDRYFMVTSRYHRRSSAVGRVFCSTSVMIAIIALCNLYYFFILGRTITLGSYDQLATLRPSLFQQTMNDSENLSQQIDTDEYLQSKTLSLFMCVPSSGYETFFRRYIPIFDILLVAVIPFFLLCFTNIGIIIYMMHANRRMRQHRKRAHRRHQRLTIMLLSVTLAFIGLTCPSVIFICVNKIIYSMNIQTETNSDNPRAGLTGFSQPSNVRIIVDVCEALWYTKHAMNFILYTLSGQDFRREFLKLFTQCFHHRTPISNKLVNGTSATNLNTGVEISLNERQMIIMTNHGKKNKKTSLNRHNLSAIALTNSS